MRDLRLDELLGSQDPRDTPSREAEALRQTINDQDIVLVDVLNVLGCGDRSAVTVAGVVVATVELVADECSTTAAEVLNFSQLGIGHNPSRRVARVGGQDDRGAPGDLRGDRIRVNMVAIFFGKRCRDGGEL